MSNINKINKIILGTAQMGLDYGINNIKGKIEAKESFEIMKFAFLNGIKHIDCAESYGDIHDTIGNFKKSNPEINFNLQTKLSSTDLKIDSTTKVKRFLKSTRTSKIQCLMFHSFSSYKEGMKSAVKYVKMKDEGLINHLGVSVYLNEEIQELIHDDNIDLIQIPFNMLDNSEHKVDLIKEARLNGKVIQARSVFLQGLFFKNPEEDNIIVKKLYNELVQLKRISEKYGILLNEMALNYVLSYEFIDYAVIGVDNLLHLKKNINSLKVNLDDKVLKEINCIDNKNTYFLNPTNW